MIIGDMEIRLRADIARLQRDMDDARRVVGGAMDSMSTSVQAFKNMLTGLAAGLSVGAFASFIKNSIDAADALNYMSARTKVAIEDLAGLSYAAKLGDTSLEGVAGAISKLGTNIGKDGAKFRELGITATEPLEAFKQLSDIFKNIQDPQQRAAFGAEALGKSWQEAAVLLDGGSEGISALIDRGKELSGITEQVAADAGKFNDGLDTLGFAAQGVGTRIAAGLLPMLNVLVDDFTATGKGADTAAGWVVVLSGAFKGLYTAGVIVATQMTAVGTAIGATAAAIVAAASGDFAGAKNIITSAGNDIAASWSTAATRISNAWSATSATAAKEGEAVSTTAAATAAKVAGFLNSGEIKSARDKSAAEAAAAAKKEEGAYAGLIASIKEKMVADQLEIDGGAAVTDTQKARIKLDEELAVGKIVLTQKHNDAAHALLDEAEALEKNAAAAKQVRAAAAALADERDASYTALVAEAAANEDLIAVYGKTKLEIAKMTLARDEDRLSQRVALDLSEDTVAQLEREIAARTRNIAAMGSLEVLDKQKKASDEAAASQVSFWKSIDDTAHATFVSILDGSKDTATRLKDTFKNVFFDWLYQQTIKKWIINVGTSSSGSVGDIATALGGGASVGGAGSSAIGLINAGKSIYEGFTTGFAGAGGALGGYVTTLGNLFGSSATSAFGAGMGLTSSQAAAASAAYNSAGMASTGSAISSGSAVGAGVGIFAGAAGGYLGGNLISGQYGSKNTVAAGTAIGAAIGSIVPVVGTALGALVGGLLGGVANRLFGMGEKKVQSTMIEGSLTAAGATGNNVSNWTQKGGWFRSDKSGTDSTALSGEQSAAFSSTYKAILDVSKVLGETIGADTSALSTRVQKLSIDLTGLATDADKLGAITKFFEGVADGIAVELVPNLTKFQKEGESLSVTMERIVGNYTGLDTMLAAVGTSFGAVGAGSIAARESFIAVNGGLTALGSGLSYFQQNFLTEAEQLAPVQKQLTDALKSMGVAGLTTNEQFKTYLLGLDKTTEAGATMFAQLLALAPAFNEITKATEAAAKAQAQAAADLAAAQAKAAADLAAALALTNKGWQGQIDQLLAARQGEAAVRALEIVGMDVTTIALRDRLAALKAEDKALADAKAATEALAKAQKDAAAALGKALLTAAGDAFNGLTVAVNEQKNLLQTAHKTAMDAMQVQIDKTSDSISKMKSLSDSLHSTIDSIRDLTGSAVDDRASAQAQVAAALAIAKAGGPLPELDSLKDALTTLAKDPADQFASYLDYQRDLYITQGSLATLADLTDDQLSTAEKTLATLEKQKDLAQQSYDAEVLRLDGLIDTAKSQLDVLNGINIGVATIPAALEAFANAIKAASANPAASAGATAASAYNQYLGRPASAGEVDYWKGQAGNGVDVVGAIKGSDEAKIQDLYKSLLNRTGEGAGVDAWEAALAAGQSWEQIKAGFMASDEYQKLHPFAVGTNFVPGDMPAMVHEGERIIPAADNRELMTRLRNPSGDNSELLAELRAQRAENAELRLMLESHLYAIAKNTLNTADSLDGAINGETPISTKEVETEETA